MRVLLQGRQSRSLALSPGGDQVQLEATAKALRERHGVDVVTSIARVGEMRSADVIHLFGLTRPHDILLVARRASAIGRPVLLSPVFCDVWEFERAARRDLVGLASRLLGRDGAEAAKAIARGAMRKEWHAGTARLLWPGFTALQTELLANVSWFLPNSHSEWQRLSQAFHLSSHHTVTVVPNGVDLSAYRAAADGPIPDHLRRFEGCVLCVGRIESRKNQLNLLEALLPTQHQVVLAGPCAPNQRRYCAAVQRKAASRPGLHVLGPVSDEEKRALYRLASVHVLPSWFETTGLSSLEAAALDCALVVTDRGDTREYFRDDVQYCEPGDTGSIRQAVERALRAGPSRNLFNTIATTYTWDAAADVTYSVYNQLV